VNYRKERKKWWMEEIKSC